MIRSMKRCNVDLFPGHLEYYYYVNAALALIGILIYFLVTRCGSNGREIRREIRTEELMVDGSEDSF